jgi:hypothetical protein
VLSRQVLAAVLVLAVLLAQSVGVLHGVVHAPGMHGHDSHAHRDAHGHHADPASDAPSVFERLFAHEDEGADCRNYDQLSHGDVLTGLAVVVLPLVLSPFVLSVLSGLATARWHALFQARGPPSFR